MRVSILVLLDVSLKAAIRSAVLPVGKVSILVLLDVSLKAHLEIGVVQDVPVSILVLLDVSLKGKTERWCSGAPYCFNPCSFGCQSERWVYRPGRVRAE